MNAPWYAVLFPVAVALGGCSDAPEPVASGEVAARVNDAAISLRQVDQAMAAAAEGLSPEQLGDARDAVLESLIDEELMVQKARARRLDHTPEVSREIEAARRQILARAYLEQVTAVDPRPSSVEIRKFYASHRALFAERRIYSFHQFEVQVRPERMRALVEIAENAHSVEAIVAALGRERLSFSSAAAVLPAEQLPFDRLGGFAGLKPGDNLLTPGDTGAQLVHLVGVRPQPLDEAAARPVIEQFLMNRERLELARDEAARLRKAASIEYVGVFARAPRQPAPRAGTAAAATPGVPTATRTAATQQQ